MGRCGKNRMQIFVYEPREERRDGLTKELNAANLAALEIGDEFFERDLSLLAVDGKFSSPFLLAADENLIPHITSLRTAGCDNPIVVMRDFRNAQETAEALRRGADHDIVIPIKAHELRARIEAVLRRANGHAAEHVSVGEVTAYLDGRDPEVKGQRVKLSNREHAIFNQLALNAGRVISKSSIYDAVYGVLESPPYDKVVDVYICKIRKKFGEATDEGAKYIETVPGRGYRLSADAVPDEAKTQL